MGAIGTLGIVGTMGTIRTMENGKTSLRTLMKVEKYLQELWAQEPWELWAQELQTMEKVP